MNAIDIFTYEYWQEQESEFKQKCRELQEIHNSNMIRYTDDNEWDESELTEYVYDICMMVMTNDVISRYTYRALKDRDLLNIPYMYEQIINEIDVIKEYNDATIPHIDGFESRITNIINTKLRENLYNE